MGVDLHEAAFVNGKVQPLAGAKFVMVVTFRTDIQIALNVSGKRDIATARAFVPEPIG